MRIEALGLLIVSIIMSGCMSNSPSPKKDGKKPTIFVKSNTAEKFKDITLENARWNGISEFFVEDKKYMRCDMKEEAMAVFSRRGFRLVSSEKEADYTFETTLLSCGISRFISNKKELPITERKLYKDFIEWIEEDENVPTEAREIAMLIAQEKKEGFERFNKGGYIFKFGSNPFGKGHWQNSRRIIKKYLLKTKGVLYPGKYYGMSKEDKEALIVLKKEFEAQTISNPTAENIFGYSALVGKTNAGLGAAGIGMSMLISLGDTVAPYSYNYFKIINNRTGKSWEKHRKFEDNWKDNVENIMSKKIVNRITWSDIDK